MLTDNLKEADLAHHRVRVQLAHIVAPVVLLYVVDVQQPGLLVVVGNREPRYLHHHVLVDGQEHLTPHVNPRHLRIKSASFSRRSRTCSRRGELLKNFNN